jgi:hypothetical protein
MTQRLATRSVPLPVYATRQRHPFLVLVLMLLLMAGVSAMVIAGSGFDLAAPLAALPQIHPLVGTGGPPAPSTTTTANVIHAPQLGSDANAFAAFYGASIPTAITDPTAEYHAQIAGHSVVLRVEYIIGVDRREHVASVNASDQTLQGWDAATADALCTTFLPGDANLRTFAHANGQTEYIYDSASLAALFFPASFVDDTGQQTPRGTFNRLDELAALAPGAAAGVSACTLALGQH